MSFDPKQYFAQNKTQIMTGAGIGGFILSTYFFIKGTVNAVRKIDAYKEEHNLEKLRAREIIKLCWRDYIFPFSTALGSTYLIIKSDQINAKETGELVSALMMSRSLLTDYKEAVKEAVDEKKYEEIEDKSANKSVERTLTAPNTEVYPTGNGNILFIENLTGTVFRSSRTAVDAGLKTAELRLKEFDYISVNELRYELDLLGHGCGEILGFNQSTGFDYRLIGGEFMGELCWYIEFYTEPVADFDMINRRK